MQNYKPYQIGRFEKVPFEQFKKDCKSVFGSEVTLQRAWEQIVLPKRKMEGSAGYDICSPFAAKIMPESSLIIPTGLRVQLSDGWFMQYIPYYALKDGFKIKLNSVDGIIDGFFYQNSAHPGHIMFRVRVEGNKPLNLAAGEVFAQGIFCPYGLV